MRSLEDRIEKNAKVAGGGFWGIAGEQVVVGGWMLVRRWRRSIGSFLCEKNFGLGQSSPAVGELEVVGAFRAFGGVWRSGIKRWRKMEVRIVFRGSINGLEGGVGIRDGLGDEGEWKVAQRVFRVCG